jgi:nitrite reductase (NADH) small subunit
VAVFKLDGDFFAYLNQCPHMGGPVCQGKMIAKVEEIVAQDRTSQGMMFSKTKMHVVCPWHAYEFDIRTGLHPGNPRAQLRKVPIAVLGDDLVIGLPDVGGRSMQGAQLT